MAWTSAQQAAIDVRNKNVLVSAAAGSGKTAVLTERVYQRVLKDRIDIDRFLIVTFTSAAAQEMKERIGDKLSKALEELQLKEMISEIDKEEIAYIERQLSLLPKASISTIHSFCLKIIRSYFHRIDIDPGFKVGNEPELEILQSDLLEELLEQWFEQEDNEDFLRLVDQYGSVRSMKGVEEAILKVHSFSKSTVFPEKWLNEKVELLTRKYKQLDDTPWTPIIKENISGKLTGTCHLFEKALATAKLPDGPNAYIATLEDDIRQLEEINTNQPLMEMIHQIDRIKFSSLAREKGCDPELKEKAQSYRNEGKKALKKIQDKLGVFKEEKFLDHIGQLGMQMQTLVSLVKEFDRRYEEAKRDRGIVDYGDQEHLALKILIESENEGQVTYTEAAQELSAFYEEVYIDEYQDSNIVQETILSAIAYAHPTKKGTRFMVGDMKQSIYRFRLANPLLFAEKYETWTKYTGPDTQGENVVIDLSQNFRSRWNILEAANDVFDQMMSKAVGELVYDEDARLKVGNHYDEGALNGEESIAHEVEMHLMEVDISEEADIDEAIQDKGNVELEAEMVATIIADLLGKETPSLGDVKLSHNPSHIYDKELGLYRKVEPRDIVILLRSAKERAILFEQALLAKGIGAYADVSNSFFDALEVQTMISLLQVIDNPLQDIPLVTVLRSPIVGVSFDELAMIRLTQKEGTFYEALQVYLQQEDVSQQLKGFMDMLDRYRGEVMNLTIEELINRLLIETGYYRYVSVLPTGARKKANLHLLIKHAVTFESTSYTGLFNFIQYLEKLKENNSDLQEAKLLGENENLVQIMTIHKSKGLEFPIVFLSNAGKPFNKLDLNSKLVIHNELGFGLKYMDTENQMVYDSIPALAIKNQIEAENISEEMRVLYVALTRPKEKLFITGTVKSYESTVKKWALYGARHEKALLTQGVQGANSYLNWIGMSLFASEKYDVLRNMVGGDVPYLYKSQSDWEIQVWNKESLSISKEEDDTLREIKREELKEWDVDAVYSDYKEAVFERLNYQYPYLDATTMPTKVSVSDIKNQQADDLTFDSLYESYEKPKEEPAFIRESKGEASELQATTKGTLIHGIFEHLDLGRCQSIDEVGGQLIELVSAHKIEGQAYEIVDKEKFVSFAHSEVMQRFVKAKQAYREQPFVYLVPADQVDKAYDSQEEMMIQGVIDAFFIEEDHAVIIDYKTDYIDSRTPELMEKGLETIKQRYQKQLDLYAKAITSITSYPVQEKWIYLYSVNFWLKLT